MGNLEKIQIKVDTSNGTERIEKITILQLLHHFGVDVKFECKDGYCGVCRCKKPIEGGVKYKEGKDPLGYIEFDDEGNPLDILPCISKIDIKSLKIDKDGIGRITFLVPKESLKQNYQEKLNKSVRKNKI